MELSEEEKKELLHLARSSIEAGLEGTGVQSLQPGNDVFKIPSGTFVTLRINNDLRGCIGYVEPRLPLWQAVQEVAKKSAFEDPRFLPLGGDEFAQVQIEISILSPLQKVTDINEIKVGTHGLVIDAGYTRGLLLPQVAVEYDWDREQFLSHTALKAGLMPDAWKSSHVSLYVFTTDVFSESQFQELHH